MSHLRTCAVGLLLAASLARCDSDATPAVDTPPDVPVEPLLGLSAISLDESGTPCILFEDGAIRCWGGHATRINGGVASGEPAIVLESGAVALALGALHGCALLGDGSVRCWGDGTLGQLGNRSGEPSALPVPAEGIRRDRRRPGRPAPAGVRADVRRPGAHVGASHRLWKPGARAPGGARQPRCRGDRRRSVSPVRTHGGRPGLVLGCDARSLSRGGDGSCAILGDTSALCWGSVGLWPVAEPSPIPGLRAPR